MKKKRVLVFIGFYLPGFKAGGPVRSLSNMVQHLSNVIDFYIITRNHDLGDQFPYVENDEIGVWKSVGTAKVLYVDRFVGIKRINQIKKEIEPDLYYFNSFFDINFSILPIFLLKFLQVDARKFILAPRGEFSDAALALKKKKKHLFVSIASKLSIYKELRFHASTKYESNDIRKNFLKSADVFIASDLSVASPVSENLEKIPRSNVLEIVFLSRISPMKNMDYALLVLSMVSRAVNFRIYGPIEDNSYWEGCKEKIKNLPGNISVDYFGSLQQSEVLQVLQRYDLLFLPSRGENFCHVIAESLSVGTPVLISDKTPWRKLEEKGFGWDLSLLNPKDFVNIIEAINLGASDARHQARINLSDSYKNSVLASESIVNNRLLFKC